MTTAPKPDVLERLALKCETASGPDRELDAEIWLLIEPIFWEDPFRKLPCPEFTKSLDAAMTLVPEGCIADTQQRRFNTALFNRGEYAWAQIESIDGTQTYSEGSARTVALALTAACLRAKAALAQECAR